MNWVQAHPLETISLAGMVLGWLITAVRFHQRMETLAASHAALRLDYDNHIGSVSERLSNFVQWQGRVTGLEANLDRIAQEAKDERTELGRQIARDKRDLSGQIEAVRGRAEEMATTVGGLSGQVGTLLNLARATDRKTTFLIKRRRGDGEKYQEENGDDE